jgi:SAM-dependent methyltransferase
MTSSTEQLSHSHHGRPGHGPAPEHNIGLAEILDLDATLGAPVLASALDAASIALGAEPAVVIDLGAGTGTGTLALAARFPHARVHSVEASPAMLARLAAAAAEAGVGDRVEPWLLDLDGDWTQELPQAADLAWASLSLHHVSDPARVLAQTLHLLRPGGVLVVIEMAGATRYTPGDLGSGRVGLGDLLGASLSALGYPVTPDWTDALSAAGFTRVQRHETGFAASARTGDGARYLALQLTLNREHLASGWSAHDLQALDTVIAALHAGASELELTSGRVIWTAVRPVNEDSVAPAMPAVALEGGVAR